jgi:hypothetical protein
MGHWGADAEEARMPETPGGTSGAGAWGAGGLPLVLLAVLAVAFLASAGVFLAPGIAGSFQRATPGPTTSGGVGPGPTGATWAPLTAEERAHVLSYAGALQPDDLLVEVRPGVQAKRSNVEGVRLDGRTVYYEVVGHQSFGPVGRGRVREQDAVVLARDGEAPFQVVIYALK